MEHCQWIRALSAAHEAGFGKLVSCLLGVDLERFDALAEHVDFFEDTLKLRFEGSLQDLEGSLLTELLLSQPLQRIKSQLEQRAEEALGRPCLITADLLLHVAQDGLLAEVVDDEEVGLVEAGIQDARQDRLVVGKELRVLAIALPACAILRVLFLDDFHQSADVDVRNLRRRHVHEGLGIDDFHVLLLHEFELHDDHVVLDVPQVGILGAKGFRRVHRLAPHHVLHLLLLLALDKQLVAVVGLLVHPVEVVGILDGHELGDGALFEDLLSALCHLLVEHLLLLRTALLLSNERAAILLQALSLQDVSCLVELIVVSA